MLPMLNTCLSRTAEVFHLYDIPCTGHIQQDGMATGMLLSSENTQNVGKKQFWRTWLSLELEKKNELKL